MAHTQTLVLWKTWKTSCDISVHTQKEKLPNTIATRFLNESKSSSWIRNQFYPFKHLCVPPNTLFWKWLHDSLVPIQYTNSYCWAGYGIHTNKFVYRIYGIKSVCIFDTSPTKNKLFYIPIQVLYGCIWILVRGYTVEYALGLDIIKIFVRAWTKESILVLLKTGIYL